MTAQILTVKVVFEAAGRAAANRGTTGSKDKRLESFMI